MSSADASHGSTEDPSQLGQSKQNNEHQLSWVDAFDQSDRFLLAQAPGTQKGKPGQGTSEKQSDATQRSQEGQTTDAATKPTWQQGLDLYRSSIQKLQSGKPVDLKDLRKAVTIMRDQFDSRPEADKSKLAQPLLSAMTDFAILLGKKDEAKSPELLQEQKREAEQIFSAVETKLGKYMRPIQQALFWDARGQNLSNIATTDFGSAVSKAQEQFTKDKNQQKYDDSYKKLNAAFEPEMGKAIKYLENAVDISKTADPGKGLQAQVLHHLAEVESERSDNPNDEFGQKSAQHYKAALDAFDEVAQNEDKALKEDEQSRLSGKLKDSDLRNSFRSVDRLDQDRLETLHQYHLLLDDQRVSYQKLQRETEASLAEYTKKNNQQKIKDTKAILDEKIAPKLAAVEQNRRDADQMNQTIKQNNQKREDEFKKVLAQAAKQKRELLEPLTKTLAEALDNGTDDKTHEKVLKIIDEVQDKIVAKDKANAPALVRELFAQTNKAESNDKGFNLTIKSDNETGLMKHYTILPHELDTQAKSVADLLDNNKRQEAKQAYDKALAGQPEEIANEFALAVDAYEKDGPGQADDVKVAYNKDGAITGFDIDFGSKQQENSPQNAPKEAPRVEQTKPGDGADKGKSTWTDGVNLYRSAEKKFQSGKDYYGALKDMRQSVKILEEQFNSAPNKSEAAQLRATAMFNLGVALGVQGPGQTDAQAQEQRHEAEKIFGAALELSRTHNLPASEQAKILDVRGNNLSYITSTDFNTAVAKAQEQLDKDKNQQEFDKAYKAAVAKFQPGMEGAIKVLEDAFQITKTASNKALHAKVCRDLANAEMGRANELDDKFSRDSAKHFKEALATYDGLAKGLEQSLAKTTTERLAGKITNDQMTNVFRTANGIDQARLQIGEEYRTLLKAQQTGYQQLQQAKINNLAEYKAKNDQLRTVATQTIIKEEIAPKLASFEQDIKGIAQDRETILEHARKLSSNYDQVSKQAAAQEKAKADAAAKAQAEPKAKSDGKDKGPEPNTKGAQSKPQSGPPTNNDGSQKPGMQNPPAGTPKVDQKKTTDASSKSVDDLAKEIATKLDTGKPGEGLIALEQAKAQIKQKETDPAKTQAMIAELSAKTDKLETKGKGDDLTIKVDSQTKNFRHYAVTSAELSKQAKLAAKDLDDAKNFGEIKREEAELIIHKAIDGQPPNVRKQFILALDAYEKDGPGDADDIKVAYKDNEAVVQGVDVARHLNPQELAQVKALEALGSISISELLIKHKTAIGDAYEKSKKLADNDPAKLKTFEAAVKRLEENPQEVKIKFDSKATRPYYNPDEDTIVLLPQVPVGKQIEHLAHEGYHATHLGLDKLYLHGKLSREDFVKAKFNEEEIDSYIEEIKMHQELSRTQIPASASVVFRYVENGQAVMKDLVELYGNGGKDGRDRLTKFFEQASGSSFRTADGKVQVGTYKQYWSSVWDGYSNDANFNGSQNAIKALLNNPDPKIKEKWQKGLKAGY